MLAYSTPFMILTSVFFFLFMIRLSRSKYTPSEKARRVIDAFGKASFGIYLIHIFFLDIYRKFVPASAVPAWIAVPVLTVVIAGSPGADCGDRRAVLWMHLAAAQV